MQWGVIAASRLAQDARQRADLQGVRQFRTDPTTGIRLAEPALLRAPEYVAQPENGQPPPDPQGTLHARQSRGVYVYFIIDVGRYEGKTTYKYGYSQFFWRTFADIQQTFKKCELKAWWRSDCQMPLVAGDDEGDETLHNEVARAEGVHDRRRRCQLRATSVVEWFSRRFDVQRATRPYLVIGGVHRRRLMSPVEAFGLPQMIALMSACVRARTSRVPLRRQYGGRRPGVPVRPSATVQRRAGAVIQRRRDTVLGGKQIYGGIST